MNRIYINQSEEGWQWGLSNGAIPSEWHELTTKGGSAIDASASDHALARHARRAAGAATGRHRWLAVTISRIGHGGKRVVTTRDLPKDHLG